MNEAELLRREQALGCDLFIAVMQANPKELPKSVREIRVEIEAMQDIAAGECHVKSTSVSWFFGLPFVTAWMICCLVAMPFLFALWVLSLVSFVIYSIIRTCGAAGLWFISLAEYEVEDA